LDEGPTVSVKVRRSPVLADDAARRDLVLATPRTSRSSRASQVVAGFLLKILHRAALDGRWSSVT
jgi:hypothetical protein